MNSSSNSVSKKRAFKLYPDDFNCIYHAFLKCGTVLLVVDGLKCHIQSRYGTNKHYMLCVLTGEYGRFCRKYGVFDRRIKGVFR